MTSRTLRRPIVLKLGGAALDDVPSIVRRIRNAARGHRPVVVVTSARAGVTDALDGLLHGGRRRARRTATLARLRRQHAGGGPGVGHELARLERLLRRSDARRRVAPPDADALHATGERIGAEWLAAQLVRAGVPAVPVAADALGLWTDGAYGAASVDTDRSRRVVRARLFRWLSKGRVPVVTGYFGRAPAGTVAVFGRGGSDLSATAIAEILDAERVILVKPESALRTADPHRVPGAGPVPRLSYAEAEELAQFGARILHPLAIGPAKRAGFPIHVVGPDVRSPGTRIGARAARPSPRIVVVTGPLHRAVVHVPGGRHRPGALLGLGQLVHGARVPVLGIAGAGSRLSILLPEAAGRRLARATAGGPADRLGPIEPTRIPVGIVSVVGQGVLRDLARLPRRALPTAFEIGGNEHYVAWVVPWRSVDEAARRLHRAFHRDRRARPAAA